MDEKIIRLDKTIHEGEKLTLDQLLADATSEKVGGEIDWGPDQGCERYE